MSKQDDKLRERRHQKADRFAAWVHTEKPDWATLGRELFRFSEETRAEALAEGRREVSNLVAVQRDFEADAGNRRGAKALNQALARVHAITQQEPEDSSHE